MHTCASASAGAAAPAATTTSETATGTTPATTTSTTDDGSTSRNAGAVAGLVIFSLALVAAFLGGAWWLHRKRRGSQPYSQFDNLNLRFLRGGSGRSSTGSRRSDFMVTEAGTTGEDRARPQTSQFSQWPGEGGRGEEVAGRGTSHSNFSQWAGATDDDRRVRGEEDAGWAQWAAGSDYRRDSLTVSQQQQQSSSREAKPNNQHLEMFDVTW